MWQPKVWRKSVLSPYLFQNSSGWEEEWGVFLEVRTLHPGITTAPSAGMWGLGTATFQPQELEDETLSLSLYLQAFTMTLLNGRVPLL